MPDNKESVGQVTYSGELKDWMQPGFEVPTYDNEGNLGVVLRVARIDTETKTIYFECV